jgi:3-hydroxyisobutyrate dehydrogenase-like beta-hydroxyacid dehydrogenase
MTNANHSGTVSVIGIGNMGSALAEALLAAGFTVTVWNRTVPKAERMVEQGAILADSPAAAALNSENTIVCVTDHAAFVSVIHNDSVATALEGKHLIQLGVVTAEQARETDAWAQARNIGYLEGSILGLPHNVKNATATLVCSGPKSLFDAVQEQLSVFGNPQLVSEIIGNAYEFDKVYYSFAYATMLGFIQGAALAQASGFSIDAYTSIVLERIPNVSENFKKFGEQIANRNHDGDQASLAVWGDAYAKSLELCRALKVDDTLPAALMKNFEKAKSEGYGDSEITAIFEVLLPKTTSAS